MCSFTKTPEESTKVNGIRIRGMDGVMKYFQQVTFTKDITRMVRRLVKELTIGLMVRCTTGNGYKE